MYVIEFFYIDINSLNFLTYIEKNETNYKTDVIFFPHY
jgi:hypothetical protein